MMFLAQRLEKIKDILETYKTIDVSTLTEILEVSDVTIRKDLERLEKEDFLTKIHGGAILNENSEIRFPFDSIIDIPKYSQKKSLAHEARQLINPEDSVFLGPGTTCLVLASELSGISGLNLITNNFNAMQLLQHSSGRLMMIGGELTSIDHHSFFSGSFAEKQLKDIFVDKAFLSVDAVDMSAGLTMSSNILMNVFEIVRKIAESVILLADSSKFSRRELYKIGDLNIVDCIITNPDVGSEVKEAAFNANIKLITPMEI